MNFQDFISHSWKIHAKETDTVYNSLPSAHEKITSNEDIAILARLITHMCGDHYLQNWQKGIELLTQLKSNPYYKVGTDSEIALSRSMAILKISAGQNADVSGLALSDQVRVYAQASGILIEHKNYDLGEKLFNQSIQLAQKLDETKKDEPAFKAIGITTNNVTCTLEEKTDRTEAQTQFMIQTSLTNLKYWSLAGNDDDVNQGVYRLTNTYIQAGRLELALENAKKCYFGSLEHKLNPNYEFYGLEMMVLCHSLLKNAVEVKKYQQLLDLVYAKLSDSEKKSTEKTFHKTMLLN